MLPENVFHLLDQRASLRLVVNASEAIQFLQKRFLALGELDRCLGSHFDEKITLAAPLQHGNAFVLDAECRTRLRSLGNFQGLLAFESWNFDLRSESRLREGN